MTQGKRDIGTKLVALILVIGLAVFLLQPSGYSGVRETVRIAANLPLTGDLAVYGTAVRDGAIMALEDLEKSGRTGPRLNADWQDNTGSPKTAVSIMQKHYLRAQDIYVSGLKPQTMAIKSQIQGKGTPHFIWIFDPYINQNSRNHFRTLASYKLEAPIYLQYVEARQPKRVVILYVSLPHTEEEFNQLVIPHLKKLGVEQIHTEPYDIGLKDYKGIAAKVKDFNPDVVIMNGFPFMLVSIVRALRPLGMITDGNTIATYDMVEAAEILGKDEVEGIRAVAPRFVTRPKEEKVAGWSERFRARFGRPPQYLAAYAYDMVMMIHDAANRLRLPASSDQWIQALRATNIECITGVPSCSFDEDGSIVTPVEVGVFREGKLVPLSEEKR